MRVRRVLLPLLLVVSSRGLAPRPPPASVDRQRPQLSRRAALATTAAAAVLGPASAAHAAYGAARGAVTSMPSTAFVRMSPRGQLEQLEELSAKERSRALSVLSERQVDLLLNEVEKRRMEISKNIERDVMVSIEYGEQNRRLREQLSQAREELVSLNRKRAEQRAREERREVEKLARAERMQASERARGAGRAMRPPPPQQPPPPPEQPLPSSEAQEEVMRRLEAQLQDMERSEAQSGKLRDQARTRPRPMIAAVRSPALRFASRVGV
eukprot:2985230-Prymnesium_polylepis.1